MNNKGQHREQIRQQQREALRERESAILEAAKTDPTLAEVAQQIQDHRDAGNYTTAG